MAGITTEFLAHVPLFRGMTEAERNQILQGMVAEEFRAGQTVVATGEESRGLHVIVEGTAKVLLEVHGFENPATGDGPTPVVDRAKLAVLDLGSTFGEVSFFHGGPHSATIIAVTDLEVFTLGVKVFEEMLRHQNLAAYKIALAAAQILADRLQAADRLIGDLVLAQHDGYTRSQWYQNRLDLFTEAAAEPRFRL